MEASAPTVLGLEGPDSIMKDCLLGKGTRLLDLSDPWMVSPICTPPPPPPPSRAGDTSVSASHLQGPLLMI